MRVLFIDSPPTLNWTPSSRFTKGGRRWPSLTVTGEKTYCYLNLSAAAVARERGHQVYYIDCQAEGVALPELLDKVKNIDPDLAVFYVEQIKVNVDFAIIKQLKRWQKAKVVFVGPFVTPLDREVMTLSPHLDFVIRGEYDYAVADLADTMGNGGKIEDIPGITWRDGEEISQGKPMSRLTDLDSLPIAAYDLIDFSNYTESVFIYHPAAAMATSRGCPYKCMYCWFPQTIYSHRWVAQSPERMFEEVRQMVERFGVREIKIDDDTFEIDRQRVVDFCELLIRHNVKVAWAPQCRPDLVDEELLRIMKRAGCIRILWGCESASQEVLDKMKKGFKVADIEKATRLSQKLGIEVLNCFMLGFPWDTEETIRQTIEFAYELNAEFTQFAIPTPLPGTEFYKLAKEEGYVTATEWDYFDGSHRAAVSYPQLSHETLEFFSKRAYHEYYLRPQWLWLMSKRALRSRAHLNHTFKLALAFVKRRRMGWI
jgi:anaerobic magnesium-protoporphyrin IX monomethyl ester cyclase